MRLLKQWLEKRRVKGMFSDMVGEDVLNYLESNPEPCSLSGGTRAATILFSSITGFSSLPETVTPEDLVQFLNRYLTPMTDIIMEHQGYVDKYEGDAIMAVWGVPWPTSEHASLACAAALAQQEAMSELGDSLRREFGIDAKVNMGLNSGDVCPANIGSPRRFSYTVVGDAVGLAARFQAANRDHGTSIIIGEATYREVDTEIAARQLEDLVVPGRQHPLKIYEMLGRK